MKALRVIVYLTGVMCGAGCQDGDPAPVRDGGRDAAMAPEGDAARDAGSDARVDACAPLECIGAPLGCRYQGGDRCTSCGTIVCDDAGAPPADGGADAAHVANDAAIDASGGLACGAGFPSFDRACAAPNDCIVLEHQINCCGALRALGLHKDAGAAFGAAELACRSSFPACECAALPTEADDGTSSDGTRDAGISCLNGQCTSTFAGAAGEVCSPAASHCGDELSCCYPCGIEGCEFRCEPTCALGSPACIDGCVLRP